MKLLFAGSECAPFVKTGGLADVMGALPKTLAAMGNDVSVVLPEYDVIPDSYREHMETVCEFDIKLGWRSPSVRVKKLEADGVTYYFIDNEYYFHRGYIYGNMDEAEAERYAFFCVAVLDMLPLAGLSPDIIHANDWQTGLIPALLSAKYRTGDGYDGIRTVFTVHNLKFQGVFDYGFVESLSGLGWERFNSDELEYYGRINFMKAGLVYADSITTVSPRYAGEILTPYFGETLDGVLRARGSALTGIVNGIDTAVFDPQTDPALTANYRAGDISGKAECKAALEDELKLSLGPDTPIIACVSRLTGQKGFDLVERVIKEIMLTDARLVVLGSGEKRYQSLFEWAMWRYPSRMAARFEYNEPLAHRIYAGADMLLMPSLFEPCGLSQLIAMRYGTVPVVRRTGGLYDTVEPYDGADGGTGFTFDNYNAHDMLHSIESACRLFGDRPAWTRLALRGMARDSSWNASASEYMRLYGSITAK